MTRPKIKTALVATFVLIALIFAGFATMSLNSLNRLNQASTEIASVWLPKVAVTKDMAISISAMRRGFLNHIIALNEAETTAAEASIEKAKTSFLKQTTDYQAMDRTDEEVRNAGEITASFTEFVATGNEMMVLSGAGKDDEAKVIQQTKIRPNGNALEELLQKAVEFSTAGATASRDSGVSIYHSAAMLTVLTGCIGFAVLACAIWFALSGIATPIQVITGSMRTLAGGDNAATVPYAGRTDEIGEMAAAVEVFRANAVAAVRLEEEAGAQRALGEDERRRNAEADRMRTQAMAQATSGLADGLKHLAGGDLTFQLAEPFAGEFEALRADFNAAVAQLADTLTSVASATHAIDSGSREISKSSDDLSKRTEQQAASLEETAAALDQITANVSNSSKRADEARTVAVKANASAAQSGKVVADAVDAMQKIEQSSNQISSIIGVIDEIAFQTNLLALNAGVEAARAGDAGRGFAVVAQEVRELAQRSAKAAKEIKDLIRNSSTEVAGGVKLVSQTGEALKTIESLIVTVNQHMDAIATSAREQSVGLSEVNTAVNQMDQVTQQNAAMVEETNAASATLANESATLRDLIGQFTLGNPGHAVSRTTQQATSLRRTASAMAAPTRAQAAAPARKAAAPRAASGGGAGDSWEEF